MKCEVASCRHYVSQQQRCALERAGDAVSPNGMRYRRNQDSLVVASVELGRVLADRKATSFRAQGYCMFPLIRPGDILHIESRSVDQVEVGDIAACRREGYLFGHRTIETGVNEEGHFIITRPDRTKQGDDGPTSDGDLVGVVSSIERSGRCYAPTKRSYALGARCYFSARLRLAVHARALREWLVQRLPRVQRTALYRHAARLWFAVRGAEPSFVVELPLLTRSGRELAIYRAVPADDFDPSADTWQGRIVNRWKLTLRLDGRRHPAAWASFVLRPPECRFAGWWLNDVHVRVRYGGANFEELLIGKAEELLARGGQDLQGKRANG